jgi:hypothetical protein
MRDKTLDIVKGFACILMIFAHSRTLGRTIDTPFTEAFWYLGFFAPVLFFASIGVSLTYQLKKRNAVLIILFNLVLFIVSFADRGRESLTYLNITNPNLIGSLALATIFVVIFRKVNGALLLVFLLFTDRILNKLGAPLSIIYGIPFALIPWAGITSLGKFLQERPIWNIVILTTGSLITLYSYVFDNQILENQFMTTLFLGISLMLYPASNLLAKKISLIKPMEAVLTFLGRNTLLFYWVHLFILFTIGIRLPAVFMWVLILILSIGSMLALKKINLYSFEKISGTNAFWLVLVLLVFLPYFLSLSTDFLFYFFSFLTVIFALNYHQFFNIPIIRKIK